MSFGTWGFKSPFAHRTVRRVVTDIVVETAAMGVVGTASARPRPAQGNPGIDVTIAGAVRFSSVAAAAGWRGASVPFLHGAHRGQRPRRLLRHTGYHVGGWQDGIDQARGLTGGDIGDAVVTRSNGSPISGHGFFAMENVEFGVLELVGEGVA